jgi:hypothetical protein
LYKNNNKIKKRKENNYTKKCNFKENINSMKKIKEWFLRYGPAEFFSTFYAITASAIVFYFTGNKIATAFAGVWGENLGFYGYLFWRDYNKEYNDKNISVLKKCSQVVRNMFVEFGVAESIDSFFIRPFLMYYFLGLFKDVSSGILAGKLAADFFFYIPAIIGFEIRKYWFKSK